MFVNLTSMHVFVCCNITYVETLYTLSNTKCTIVVVTIAGGCCFCCSFFVTDPSISSSVQDFEKSFKWMVLCAPPPHVPRIVHHRENVEYAEEELKFVLLAFFSMRTVTFAFGANRNFVLLSCF